MRNLLKTTFAVAAVVSISAAAMAQQTITFARYPALSPDGNRLVFSYQGDLWATDVDSKQPSRRLTVHAAYDARPFISPDGKHILFTSNRLGRNDAYIMPIDGGTPTRLTSFSGGSVGIGWAPDGKSILVPLDGDLIRTARSMGITVSGKAPWEV